MWLGSYTLSCGWIWVYHWYIMMGSQVYSLAIHKRPEVCVCVCRPQCIGCASYYHERLCSVLQQSMYLCLWVVFLPKYVFVFLLSWVARPRSCSLCAMVQCERPASCQLPSSVSICERQIEWYNNDILIIFPAVKCPRLRLHCQHITVNTGPRWPG